MCRSIATVFTIGLSFAACADNTSFNSQSEGRVSMSASELMAGGQSAPDIGPVPESTLESCRAQHKALRIAFVIDNSGSNDGNPDQQEVQKGPNFVGTDPRRMDNGIVFTSRQKAVYETIFQLAQMDQKLHSEDKDFQGSALGISYFPKNNTGEGSGNYSVVSGGISVLPEVMTETLAIETNSNARQDLWKALGFTYRPDGMTPYQSALESAREMLLDTRSEEDARPDVVMLITDGLPSDEKIEPVRAVRRELGDTKIVLLSLYQTEGTTQEQRNAPARNTLETYYNTRKWGAAEFGTFGDYWNALLKLPGELIGDPRNEIRVNINTGQLMKQINETLLDVLECQR